MLGAIIGDIVGSVYEFDNIKDTRFPFYGKESNFTDDSIMTIAVADYLLTPPEQHETLERTLVGFAKRYKCPKGGYGGRFRKWLFHPEELSADGQRHPINSWGNGSAMRVSSVGWLYNTLEDVEKVAKETAEITHNHPEGIKGAQATAVAIFMARQGRSKEQIRAFIEQRYGYNLHRTCDEIRPTYRFNESCQGTVPEAIIAFLESHDFEHAIRLAVSLGGDSDTLACITGGIAEAFYKDIPDWIKQGEYALLPDYFKQIIAYLYECSKNNTDTANNKSQPTREQLLNFWKLEDFYKMMAEEEGTEAPSSRTEEIPLLDFSVAGMAYCKEFIKTGESFLKNGMPIIVKREDNKYDANAIALYVDDVKIGYVPKSQNAILAKLIDADKLLIARVIDTQYENVWKKISARISMIEL